MKLRKTEREALDLRDRINEYSTRRVLIRTLKDELQALKGRLEAGDKTALKRTREIFDLLDAHNEWIANNLPIIKSKL